MRISDWSSDVCSSDLNEARQAADVDGEAFEAFDEIGEMLAREQRGRTYKRDLNPRHRGDEAGAERDLGLAEPDVAADEPVLRAARRHVGQHVADRAVLLVGFLIWEAGGYGRVGGVLRMKEMRRGVQGKR